MNQIFNQNTSMQDTKYHLLDLDIYTHVALIRDVARICATQLVNKISIT